MAELATIKKENEALKMEKAEYEAVETHIMKTIKSGGKCEDCLKAHYREGKVVDGVWFDEEEDEEEEEEYDPRFSSHEAFNEWLTDELDLYHLLDEWDEFIEIKEKWCIENNHEIKEDGVYNMNIKEEKKD